LSRSCLIDYLTSVLGFGVVLSNSITFSVTRLSISADVGFVTSLVDLLSLLNADIILTNLATLLDFLGLGVTTLPFLVLIRVSSFTIDCV
jgi:hypothetical protein